MKRSVMLLIVGSLMVAGGGVMPASAQLFGSDAKNWEKVLVELKKINARLVTLHTRDLPTLHGNQADLKDQVDHIRGMFPGLQGKLEENNTRQEERLRQLEARLGQVDSAVKSALARQTQVQQEEIAGFKKDMTGKFEELKQSLAKDTETIAAANQAQLQAIQEQNQKAWVSMKQQLDKQADLTGQVIDHLTRILDSTGRQYQEVTRRLEGLKTALSANRETLAAGFKAIEENNKVVNANTGAITKVLKKGFTEQEQIRQKVEALGGALTQARAQVETTRKAIGALKEILDPKLDQVIQNQAEHAARTGEVQKVLAEGHARIVEHLSASQKRQARFDEKFNTLIDTTQALLTHSGKVGEQVSQLGGKVDTAQTGVQVANEKIVKLIEVLKVMAADQQKLDGIQQGVGALQSQAEAARAREETLLKNTEQIRQGLGALQTQAEAARAHEETLLKNTEQIQQGLGALQTQTEAARAREETLLKSTGQIQQGLGALQTQTEAARAREETLLKSTELIRQGLGALNTLAAASQSREEKILQQVQKEGAAVQKRLEDLRRKANVTIARNDDILKLLKTKGAPAGARKPSAPGKKG